MERRPAPGGGGQRKPADPARNPNPGFDHLPELLPAVSPAGWHDRHSQNRGGGIREDLQAGGHRRSHQPHPGPPGPGGSGLQNRIRQVARRCPGDRRGASHRASGVGGHHQRGEKRGALSPAAGRGHPPQPAQCQA